MSYEGLRRIERVEYSGITSGYGEAYVDVAKSDGNGGVSYSKEWKRVKCRNVPYEGHEDVDITINVDDDPFNNKVEQTSDSVHAVSGTVELFQSAQIRQVSDNAIEIAKSLKNGFNSVVASEISQQIGVVEERSKNSYQLLLSLKHKMEDVIRTMEKDYNSIKGCNVKQFDGINKQYTDMIHALDASSFSMSKELAASMQSYAQLEVATQALLPEDSSKTRNNLEEVQLNRTSSQIIGGISHLLRQNNAYNAFIQNKISNTFVEKEEQQNLPVLYMEMDDLKANRETSTCFMHIENQVAKKSIENAVRSALHNQTDLIENDYQEGLKKKMDSSNLDERELNVIRSLMNDNGI